MSTLTLNKSLKFTPVMEKWLYQNPEDIVERLMERCKKEEATRKNKHRRIAYLTKKAMNKGTVK